jgi:hypothetical protein
MIETTTGLDATVTDGQLGIDRSKL